MVLHLKKHQLFIGDGGQLMIYHTEVLHLQGTLLHINDCSIILSLDKDILLLGLNVVDVIVKVTFLN
jgi:hypothetical protein